jgi:DNA-binding NtrC family response regulator
MSTVQDGWTTASLEAIPRLDASLDPTPGFALIYSRLHRQLPSAIAFVTPVTTIGREADNILPIAEAAVSRYHASIERRDEECWVIDKGSTNGTLVEGERVESRRLIDHEVVRIGDTLFRFVARGIAGYGAYRLDGSVIEAARPVRHAIRSHLVGGYQIDLILERVEKVARTQLACVIVGESGTGKELLARTIHEASERKGPLQAINCAALPANLIESELFGYRKGAFTGATHDKPGLVRAAHGGTLFLDEIGDMPLEAQAKLLRVVQEREVQPLGSTTPERVDVRVVCATHRDLEAEVLAGRFRGDLLARLREFAVRLPPLRERREDLYPLVLHFLQRAGRPDATVTLPFMLALSHYAWPYNVRELESAVKLSIALSDGREIDLRHLPDTVQQALRAHGAARPPRPSAPPARLAVEPVDPAANGRPPPSQRSGGAPTERELREILARHRGNIAAVGRELGKERMQVHRWLKRYAIDINDYRD